MFTLFITKERKKHEVPILRWFGRARLVVDGGGYCCQTVEPTGNLFERAGGAAIDG